jgi:photosynthetic reaction center cytochrome c subunit
MNLLTRTSVLFTSLAAALLLAGCERPPIDTKQIGYRGTAMEQNTNPRTEAKKVAANVAPPQLDAGSPEGPKAKDVLQNVQVLGDLSLAQFTAQMVAITAWVAPEQGCNYCHVAGNFADDSVYTKIVARKMIQMTQNVNANWKQHVANTGVTCYTCHRGNNVPTQTWFQPKAQDKRADFIGNRNGQNRGSPTVGLSSLPADPVTMYLTDVKQIRVGGTTALPTGNDVSLQATEGTYALMFHFSQSLGVNCTACHNSRHFGSWDQSPPQRTTAWHGINMVRDLNVGYTLPLGKVLPPNKLGPNGDTPLVACATCHQGVNKPLYGAPMAKNWPGLQALSTAAPAAAASAPQ